MHIASRFAIAVHILALLGAGEGTQRTSEAMAGSIGVHPVIVRTVTGMLRRAGLVRTQQGVAGARLARPLAAITLLDVYRAVDAAGALFPVHSHQNPHCPIGSQIQGTLAKHFGAAQHMMEARLAGTTMQQVVRDLRAVSAR
jgi:DNA-binding IscR family transcriptional regulator